MLRLSLSPAYGTSDTTATAAALARMYGLTPAGNHDHNQTLTRGEDCRTPNGWTSVRQSFLKRIFHIHIFARPIPHFDRWYTWLSGVLRSFYRTNGHHTVIYSRPGIVSGGITKIANRRPHAGSACVRRHLFEKTLQPYKGGVISVRGKDDLGVNMETSYVTAPPLPKLRHLVYILYNLITTNLTGSAVSLRSPYQHGRPLSKHAKTFPPTGSPVRISVCPVCDGIFLTRIRMASHLSCPHRELSGPFVSFFQTLKLL